MKAANFLNHSMEVYGEPPVYLVRPRRPAFLAGRVRIPRTGMADARQHAELVFSEAGPSWARPTLIAAWMYLRTVPLDGPVPGAICRPLLPACQRRITSAMSTRDLVSWFW